MSAARYELWLSGRVLARYRTQGQALLGAVWRSRKARAAIYVWYARAKKGGRYVATVTGEF